MPAVWFNIGLNEKEISIVKNITSSVFAERVSLEGNVLYVDREGANVVLSVIDRKASDYDFCNVRDFNQGDVSGLFRKIENAVLDHEAVMEAVRDICF